MFDDPLMLILLLVLVATVGGLIWVKRRGGSPSASSKSKHGGKLKAETASTVQKETEQYDEDWGVSSSAVDDTKVSVQDVDALTEFNVYKQFGYYDKAAESLSSYITVHNGATPELVVELADLWLSAGNIDALSDTLTQYQSMFAKEKLTELIKAGLSVDANHLGLRVLAESSLGWTVQKTAEEIGEKTISQAPEREVSGRGSSRRSASKIVADEETKQHVVKQLLVTGQAKISGLANDEKGAVLAFMEPEKSVKLLKDSLNYDAAVKYLNKAIRSSRKPAALLIDALTLDYRANNINGFARHLWNLYYSLGQYGRQVKERMLGWGYSLGQHNMFDKLETNPTEATLREMGIQQGFIDGGSLKKARYQSLVLEKTDVEGEPRTPAERILKEAESLLMYGQLENAVELLEQSIEQYPQESQLYIMLFDLYERAEEWDALEALLQKLRPQVQSLPEEVVLAMSQILQRLTHG